MDAMHSQYLNIIEPKFTNRSNFSYLCSLMKLKIKRHLNKLILYGNHPVTWIKHAKYRGKDLQCTDT